MSGTTAPQHVSRGGEKLSRQANGMPWSSPPTRGCIWRRAYPPLALCCIRFLVYRWIHWRNASRYAGGAGRATRAFRRDYWGQALSGTANYFVGWAGSGSWREGSSAEFANRQVRYSRYFSTPQTS